MLIDGKKIARDIQDDVRSYTSKHGSKKLVAIQVGENAVSESFLRIKKKFGEEAGVSVEVERIPSHVSTEALSIHVQYFAAKRNVAGIIVQLPLPAHIDSELVLSKIPPEKDPDVLSSHTRELFRIGKLAVLPPVVAAVKEILARNNVTLQNKKVVVIGEGSLVGKPVSIWLSGEGVEPTIVTKTLKGREELLQKADIIISGAGSPGIITPDHIQSGVIIIDAGTSEVGAKIAGDADPRCAEKAALFTPVPGGVGPVAVAMLFKNLITLSQ